MSRPRECAKLQNCSKSKPKRGARPRSTDRKSTRLNSSHITISYAVFCLKKKKKNKNRQEKRREHEYHTNNATKEAQKPQTLTPQPETQTPNIDTTDGEAQIHHESAQAAH